MDFVETMIIEVSHRAAAGPADPPRAVPALHVRGGARTVRIGQAGHPLRPGARRPRGRARRTCAHRLPGLRRGARRPTGGSGRSGRPAWVASAARSSTSCRSWRSATARRVSRTSPWTPRGPSIRRSGSSSATRRCGRWRTPPAPRRATSSSSWPTPSRRRARSSAGCALEVGSRLGLADPDVLAYCWVHHFPMYQWDAEFTRWDATHNPFSGPVPEDLRAHDHGIGRPLGPDARRIPPAGRARSSTTSPSTAGSSAAAPCASSRRDELERSFQLQGHTLEAMHEKFGGMLEAFDFGAPPHGGIALGVDRWAALLAYQTNIREVMAFPKTQSGRRPHARRAVRPGPGAVGRARTPVRRRDEGLTGTP